MQIIKDEEYLINDSTIGVANYLVSLYKRTGDKYQCNSAKINRLLTIYKLCSLKYNDKCLSDSDFIIEDDGTMGIPRCFHSAFYNFYSLIPESYNEIDDELEEEQEHKIFLHSDVIIIKEQLYIDYKKQLRISKESKELLELIFRKFGNYPYADLSAQINVIIKNIPLRKEYRKNYIKLKDFNNFIYQKERSLKYNDIFEFIKNFDRLQVNKSYSLILKNSHSSKK